MSNENANAWRNPMNIFHNPRPFLFSVAAIFLLCATTAPHVSGQQGQTGPSGDLSVVGEVSVNGTSAISGATVFSDSTITTKQRSSAVVSLGKLGRVEVLAESTIKLSFDRSRITVRMLNAGRVRISSSSGTAVTAITRDGETSGDRNVKNEIVIDTRCGNTTVFVKAGRADLRDAKSRSTTRIDRQQTIGTGRAGCTARE
jgi:hypothetical protein